MKLEKEILVIGEYFQNGGETYTRDELLNKIERDLAFDRKQGTSLIAKCVNKGFIIECSSGIYTR